MCEDNWSGFSRKPNFWARCRLLIICFNKYYKNKHFYDYLAYKIMYYYTIQLKENQNTGMKGQWEGEGSLA